MDDLKCPHCSKSLNNRGNREKDVEKCYREKQEEKRRRLNMPKLNSFFPVQARAITSQCSAMCCQQLKSKGSSSALCARLVWKWRLCESMSAPMWCRGMSVGMCAGSVAAPHARPAWGKTASQGSLRTALATWNSPLGHARRIALDIRLSNKYTVGSLQNLLIFRF